MLDLPYRLLRPILFRLDPETAHETLLGMVSAGSGPLSGALRAAGGGPPPASLARNVAGLRLAGPVGLAAGLDKNGEAVPFWPALGFGFVEVGTVTAHPQAGNEKPRLFRLPESRALINRMGFNNRGSEDLARRLASLREKGRWPAVPVGVNLGKSKVTPNEEAVDDYVTSLQRLEGLADYFTINVSSPNTPGLRDLQGREALEKLLPAVRAAAGETPVFLKLAPDLATPALAEAVDLAVESGLDGIIAVNTTITRPPNLIGDSGQAGGLSGRPLWPLARNRIEDALNAAGGRLPVIGVGGIETAAQVRELLEAGCAAVQVYTALIYQGPGLPGRIHRELARGVVPPGG